MTKPAKAIATNTDVKSYLDRANNILNEIDTLTEDKKELWAEMKSEGIDTKAFAIALKEIRKPMDAALRAKVNVYLEVKGQFILFA